MLTPLRKYLPALCILTLGVGLTLAAWKYAKQAEVQELQQRFTTRVNNTVEAIEERFFTYRQVLRGGVGLFHASENVSRMEWRRYVEDLRVNELYPGIQGIGFAEMLKHSELDQHLAAVRAEGFENYRVHPLDPQREPTSIVFLEPFDVRNQRAFGYDMYSNATRRAAMARARDTGMAALSGRVTLLQEMDSDLQAGTLLYLPVYKHGAMLNSIEDRRKALQGWVYSPFRMNDLMNGILGQIWSDISLRIYDGESVREGSMLYGSHARRAAAPMHSRQLEMVVAGRTWTVLLETLPSFEPGIYSAPSFLLLGGLLLTAVLTLLVFTMRNSEARAAQLAEDMSAAFRASERRQRAILENTADGILTVDGMGVVRSFNKAAETMFGFYAHEVIGNNVSMLMPQRFAIEHDQHIESMETSQAHRTLGVRREVVGRRRNGEEFPVWLAVNRIPGVDRNEYVGSVSDLTERKKILAELQHLAHHDALTNLPNRTLLNDRIEQAIQRARRDHKPMALLMLDLDHFKRINDSLGHHVGDDLLQHVAQRFKACVREIDTVARMGGDEFVILLPEVGGRANVQVVIDKLQNAMMQAVPLGDHDMIVSPSIGVSMFPQDGKDSANLLKNADTAMYHAKAEGRGRCKFFDADMQFRNDKKLETETALRRAMAQHEFSLEYQPQVDMLSGEVTGCEALLRWTHPEFGRVPPDQFVPLAEELGLIRSIGQWVLNTACREVRAMQDELGRSLNVAVNISPQQFFRGDIVEEIREALGNSGLPAKCLEVEITEGVLLENSQATIETLREIREMGVSVAIDDFGTGYSSLSYLTRFPIDKLKVDQSFVQDVTVDSTDAAVTSAIIVMAHTLKLSVVAEGVETGEQFDFLLERQCNTAQGYYFGRPMSRENFVATMPQVSAGAAQALITTGTSGNLLH